MNVHAVFFVLSIIGGIVSAAMFIPALWSFIEGWADAAPIFCCALAFTLAFTILAVLLRPSKGKKNHAVGVREAFAIVTFSWIVASAIGSVPYLVCHTVNSFTDGFFEAMSGFSTTGATIIENIESNPRGILFWRALTHWLGGMGIVVLSLAFVPFLGGGGMELFKAESPGPVPEKITPRLQQTAMILWLIYIGLTIIETVALMFCGMSLYDALTHSFSTVATGGFSVYNDSIAHFQSPAVEWVISIFTFLAGVNFSLHYLFLCGNLTVYLRDEEFCLYAKIIIFASAAFALGGIFGAPKLDAGTAVRHGVFQTITLMTTTGFAVTDTLKWPYFVHALQLCIMVIGGCAGSTGGGIKVVRLLMIVRHAKNGLIKAIQPQRMMTVRINDKPQSQDLVGSVLTFFICYLLILAGITVFEASLGLDTLSALSGTLSCISNVGPALGSLGPLDNYAAVPSAGKWGLSFAMLVGRLEITTVLMLFMPRVWLK